MDTNHKQPHRVFEKTKERYGQMMESYATDKKNHNPIETDFQELESIRQQSRDREEKRKIHFQVCDRNIRNDISICIFASN